MSRQQTQNFLVMVTFGMAFFVWGFVTVLNSVMVEHVSRIFDVRYSVSTLIQLTFFSMYLLVAIPAGKMIKNWGYKLSMIIGMFTIALGCMLYYFAIYYENYFFFLSSLAVQATGVTLLQVGANLFILFYGNKRNAAARLTLMQAFNALGAFLAPTYGAVWVQELWGVGPEVNASLIQYVHTPFILLSNVLYLITIALVFVNIPEFNTSRLTPQNAIYIPNRKLHAMHFKQLRLGAFAIFAYLGAEVSLGNYLLSDAFSATDWAQVYWGGFMLGRFVGAFILLLTDIRKALAAAAILASAFLLLSEITVGITSITAIGMIGFFNAIMLPVIFYLGLKGLGRYSEQGASILVMFFVGAGIIPFNVVNFADPNAFGYKVALVIPLLCYLYILYYSLSGSTFESRKAVANPDDDDSLAKS